MAGAYDKYLDAYIEDSDIGGMVVRAYLFRLLGKLWEDKDSFRGKSPFGNSGWDGCIYDALINAGLAKEGEEDFMDQIIGAAIKQMMIDATYDASAALTPSKPETM